MRSNSHFGSPPFTAGLVPEQRDRSGAVLFSPRQKQLTLRLDADLIEWFKPQAPNGEGYQISINSALREHVAQRRSR